jgi:hypothetical protein
MPIEVFSLPFERKETKNISSNSKGIFCGLYLDVAECLPYRLKHQMAVRHFTQLLLSLITDRLGLNAMKFLSDFLQEVDFAVSK